MCLFEIEVFEMVAMAVTSITSVQVSSVAQSCLTLCDPMDCRLPGSSVRGILQARVLEWVAIAEYIMRNDGLEEAQAGIKTAGRNINNL